VHVCVCVSVCACVCVVCADYMNSFYSCVCMGMCYLHHFVIFQEYGVCVWVCVGVRGCACVGVSGCVFVCVCATYVLPIPILPIPVCVWVRVGVRWMWVWGYVGVCESASCLYKSALFLWVGEYM